MKRAMDFVQGWIPVGGGRRVYGETKEVVSVMWWTWKRLALCMLVLASLPFLFPVLFLSLFVGLMVSMPLLCGVAAYLVVFRGFSLPWNLTKSALPKLLPAQRTAGSRTRVFVRQAEGPEGSPTVESQGHELPKDLFLSEAGVEGIKPAQEVLESEHKAEETARELGLPKVSGVGYPIEDQPGRQLPIAVKVPITDTFSGEDSADDVVRAGVEIDSGELPDSDVESKSAKGSEIRPDGDDLEAEGVANGEFVEDEVPAKASEDISGAEESSREQTETDRSSESLLPPGLSQRHHIVDDQTGEDITKVQRTSEGISRVSQFESYGRMDGASLELESAPAYHSFTDGVRTEDSSMQEDTTDPFVEAESSKEQGPGREGLVSGPLHVAEVPTLSQQSPLDAEHIGEDAEVELLPSFPRGAHGVPMEVAQEPSFTLGELAEKGLRSEAPVSGAHAKDQGEGEGDAALEGLVSSAPGQLGEQSERELRLGAPRSGASVGEQGEGEADATPEVSLSVAPGQLGEQPPAGLISSKDQGGGEMDATPETSLNVQPYEEEAQQKPTEESFLNSMIPGKPRDEIEEKSPLPSAGHPTEARHGLKGMLTQLVTGVLGESRQEADGIGLIPKASPSPADRMNVSEQPEESLSEASAVHEHATSSGGEVQDELEKGFQSSKDQGGAEIDATPETSLNVQPYEEEAQQKPTEESFLNSMIPGKPRDEIEEKSPLPSAGHPTEARHGLKGMLTQLVTGVLGESRQEADGIGLIPKASPSPADRMNVSEQPEESLSEASAVHEHATSSGGEVQDELEKGFQSSKDQGGAEIDATPETSLNIQPYEGEAQQKPTEESFLNSMTSGKPRDEIEEKSLLEPLPSAEHPTEARHGLKGMLTQLVTGVLGESRQEADGTGLIPKASPSPADRMNVSEQPEESLSEASAVHEHATSSGGEAQDVQPSDASLEPAGRQFIQNDHPYTSPSIESGEQGQDPSPESLQIMQKISPTAANLTKAGEQPTESSPGVSTFHGFTESRREAQDEMTADASLKSFEPAERFSVQEDHPDTSLSMKSGEKGGEDSSPERQQSMAHHRVQEENVLVPSADKSVRYTTGPAEEASEMSALRTSASGPLSTETKEGRVEPLRTEVPMETAPFMEQKGEDEESRQKLLLSGKEAGEGLNEEATLGSSTNTGRLGNLREESEESTHTASSGNAHYRLPFKEVDAESTLETTPNTDKFLDLRSPEASTAASLSISSDDARKLTPEFTMPLKKPEAEPQEKILAEPIRDGTHVLEQRAEAESVPALPETTVQQKPIPSTEPANAETSLRYDLPRFEHARRLSFSRTGEESEDIESDSLPVPGQPKGPRLGEERSEIEYVEPETHLEPGQFKGPRSDEDRSTFTHTSSEYAWPSESSEHGYQESLAEKELSKPFELQTPAQADSESGPSSESADDWQRRRERWEAESRPGGLLQSAPNMQPHSFEARSMCNPLYEFSTPSPLPRRSSTGVSKDFSFTSSSDFSQALKRHSAPEYRHSRPSLSDSALSPPHHRFREFKKGRYREWSEHVDLGKSFTPGFPPRSYSASWSESLEPYEGEFEGLLQYWQERDKATPSPSPTSLTKYTSATSPAVLAAQLREEINTIQRIVGQDIEPQHSLWKDVESLSELVGMELPYMGDVSDLMKARQGLDLVKVVVGIRWDVEQDEYSK